MTLPASKPACILVLQGGGAMGAYHVGAFQALQEGGFEPDWVCGISMGAINGALIAGNASERRLERLNAFWSAISRPCLTPPFADTNLKILEHYCSFVTTLLTGQPGFFEPRPFNPFFAPSGVSATSFYDTRPLYQTLSMLVDLDHLNNGTTTRLSVGATNVETGQLEFFDTRAMKGGFCLDHIAASGALPPGFPAVRIGDRLYWDGGCASNSPLEAVLDDMPQGHSIAFIIDLWSSSGPAPQTMSDVLWRAKQIQYASKTMQHIKWLEAKINLRHALSMLENKGAPPPDERLDLVHVIYHPDDDQIPYSDAEFSQTSIAQRRAAGYADMQRILADKPWLRIHRAPHIGCVVHRVSRDGIMTVNDDACCERLVPLAQEALCANREHRS
ncbi:patatin-like phospholipase family protein [Beijerinckia mobilis]|uniref:patatin-like phospholipase family protein n=1 Tax=Beijerinckia mobilis TaxID=231434 RepID=UPI00068BCB05|nr:patatin-like phospholipase family protein [Beijerinckia mobilis]